MGSEVIIVPAAFLMVGVCVLRDCERIHATSAAQVDDGVPDEAPRSHGQYGRVQRVPEHRGRQDSWTRLSSDVGAVSAHQRVLRAFQSGIVMVCLGVGIFMYLSGARVDTETYESLGFVGTVSAAVGLGLLISGYVSLRLSRRMGLINGQSHASTSNEVARSV